ncbi:MAG TPA: hypothetical protein DIU49_07165 [Desulfovibrio sp.]|nr:hypothetical protein [Desulfovibrio sp.]
MAAGVDHVGPVRRNIPPFLAAVLSNVRSITFRKSFSDGTSRGARSSGTFFTAFHGFPAGNPSRKSWPQTQAAAGFLRSLLAAYPDRVTHWCWR